MKTLSHSIFITLMAYMLPTTTLAANTHAATQQNMLSMFPMLAAFGLFFYFMIIRPQNKRNKERKDTLSALSKGDEVVTTGGIVGTIESITDNFIRLSIANDVNISIKKDHIAHALPKGTMKNISTS